MLGPICVDCNQICRITQIGVAVLTVAATGPYQMWSMDESTCPKCNRKIIDRAHRSDREMENQLIVQAFQKDFFARIQAAHSRGILRIVCYPERGAQEQAENVRRRLAEE